ncbi:MAG: DNA replication/repair protein RecF [Alicyclobacillus macrosporangiidus]|uniref:DNA replication/repair protein RecF n=1 Tax=Alicyclobacillus macrosporangiidus TaxID=392015 RepID=UPI0026EF0EA0|nr:DNA replication/repair protein RecF [Alicyclobacillus macrosporangiidus]MCL6598764.1 DNA replication/repair protein RecF [Alicyclobacillus macrosporangiidus]
MHIEWLELTQYRNYTHQRIEFSPGVNVFIGENAQGKTNALEAVYFLAMGRAHRTSRDADCIQWGADGARVSAQVITAGRPRTLAVELHRGAKRAEVNGVLQAKMTDFVGHFQVVLFAPEDLQLVKGAPAARRRFIDMEIGQTQPKYLYHLAQYQRALQQRNAFLKQDRVDNTYLEVLEAQMADHGAEVVVRRHGFLTRLRGIAQRIHDEISDGRERFTFQYRSPLEGLGEAGSISVAEVREALLQTLGTRRAADLQTGHTSVGPHRDDLLFFIDGQPVQSFASQGQQRTIALSLRLAEIDLIRDEVGEYPVLLLDDVLSELDNTRQQRLVWSMSEKVQTILTTTALFPIQGNLRLAARLFQVRSGIIQKEG